ncbi:MAG: 4Fe-4S dicluster domain-containing protein, partial [Candidatus Thorarchaeota archaeon]
MSFFFNDGADSDNLNHQILEESIKNVIATSNYCYACNRCVNVCPLSHLNHFFPRELAGDLIFSSMEEVTNKHNIWNCLTCGQCTIYCPMNQGDQGINIPKLILELRKNCRKNQIQINRIAQCETHNEIFPLIWKLMINDLINPNKLEFLKGKILKTADSGDFAYFIG